MKNGARLGLSILALTVGLGILGLSLTAVTPAQSASGVFEASSRHVYWNDEILPDHMAYPALMVLDRVKLEAAVPTERVYLQVEYGTHRLSYVQKLIDKDNKPLALSTATKGYKYLLNAAQDSLDQEMPEPVQRYVLKAIEFHLKEMPEIEMQLADSDRAILDALKEENRVMVTKLRSSLATR